MITRYVNTGSAGGDGTTPGLSGGTAAFATLQAALDSIGASTSDAWTINCAGTAPDTQAIIQATWDMTTSAANYIRIVGDNTTGKWNTSAYRLEISNGDAIYNDTAGHVRLENMQSQVTLTTGAGDDFVCYRLATANNLGSPVDHRYLNCLARPLLTGGTNHALGFSDSDPGGSGGTCRRVNCIAYGSGYAGFNDDETAWANSSCINYNCTSYGMQFNYLGGGSNYNCLADANTIGDGFDFVTSGGTQSHNASGDGSATGTGSRINQNTPYGASDLILFVSPGTGTTADFHLQATSSQIGVGVDNPGSGFYSTDIDGQTRTSTWDIGADEYQAAGASVALSGSASTSGSGTSVPNFQIAL